MQIRDDNTGSRKFSFSLSRPSVLSWFYSCFDSNKYPVHNEKTSLELFGPEVKISQIYIFHFFYQQNLIKDQKWSV